MASIKDAAERRVVRLPDGRTARLVAVPGKKRLKGAKDRVRLPSGAVLSVPAVEIVFTDDENDDEKKIA